jgi:alkylation response protein AidB-like acyl-CoA dehydrogenase
MVAIQTSATAPTTGLDAETLSMMVAALHEFVTHKLPDSRALELDHEDVCPEDLVRAMCGEQLGIQLLFIPEQYGGMGGGSFDVYRVCEQMARLDVGIATSVLATFLGSDPLFVGATPEQKQTWLTRIADNGILFAYGATEPEAGSDLGALRTTATPLTEDGKITGYRLNGRKQWISNGGIADAYTILARAPGGPTWFLLERGAEGFSQAKPEDKHGIRLSNTAALYLDDVFVPVDNLVGGVEGQGLVQAQQVFGYTRLMVAAFGLGAGWSAVDRAITFSTQRIQAGAPLSEKQGYTHKLIVPHVVRLEAARASIEETATRIDDGEGENGALNTDGAVAKYFATESGNAAAEAAIQAHGGYGYTRDYIVEKIKRDVRITTIYEGTSEIMEMTIARDRWQQHLKTRGGYYQERAGELDALHARRPEVGADAAALASHALSAVLEACRVSRLTRNQHVLFRIGELIAWAECAASLARRAASAQDGTLPAKADARFAPPVLAAISRVFARDAALTVAEHGLRWVRGAADPDTDLTGLEAQLRLRDVQAAQSGLVADMDAIADALYDRSNPAR